MNNTLKLAALSSCMCVASAASADVPFYTPDLVSGEIATPLTVSPDAAANALPGVQGFWTDMINTENVAAGGEGVYVAVLDTGMVSAAPFFFSEANIAWHLGKGFSHDMYWDDDEGLVIGPVRDDRGFWTEMASGHGTHVTSTIAGFNVNNAFWVDGVAPQATIIPVLVLDAWYVPVPDEDPWLLSGGTDEMIAAGIYYVADLSDTLDGPVVINMSLGGPTPSPMIEAAIDYAIDKGVHIVVSAGNSGTDGLGYPGGLEQVISTGAVGWTEMFGYGWGADVPEELNKKDSIGNNRPIYLEDFSSRPNKDNFEQKHQDLDVSAPGAWVVGPYKSDFANDLNYYYLSGTSMAAPHVAGMAAVILGEYPDLVQAEMEAILSVAAAGNSMPSDTAEVLFPFVAEGYYTASWGGGDYGAGFLQLDQALDVADRY